MRYILMFLFTIICHILDGQVITNYASGVGIYDPNGLAFDRQGDLYITTLLGCTIVKIDTAGIITTIAGTGSPGFSGDGGPAIAAELNIPLGITIDSMGNILFVDQQNQRIRKIDVASGIITTIVGTGPGGYSTGGFSGDSGTASSAQLNNPSSVCFDKFWNLYIADVQNYRIRKVNTSGIISTIAGNGLFGDSGDGGAANEAKIYPTCICTDYTGNLYLSNYGVIGSGCNVRKINTSGIITTIASDSAICSYNGDDIPATSAHVGAISLTVNDGLLYLSDACNNRVRYIDGSGIIHTVAGNGMSGDGGDGHKADSAQLRNQSGIAFDHCGNLYIGQVDSPCIRKVTFNPSCTRLKVPQITASDIVIHPNPATEIINVDNVAKEGSYEVINITGIIEQSGKLNTGTNTIGISSIFPGLHMLVLKDEDGGYMVHKIVKE